MIRGTILRIPSTSPSASVRFWTETLGVKLAAETASGFVLDLGNSARVELFTAPPSTPRATVGLGVANLERSVDLLENRGVAFRSEASLREQPVFSDPDGNTLFLFLATDAQ